VKKKKQAHEKIQNYGKFVREMYWPKVSEKNQNEMAMIRDKVMKANTAMRKDPARNQSITPGLWRAEMINKSQSQAHLPMKKIDVRS